MFKKPEKFTKHLDINIQKELLGKGKYFLAIGTNF